MRRNASRPPADDFDIWQVEDGADYRPHITVRNISSVGRSHRIYWPTSRRIHHFLSDLEERNFLEVAWTLSPVDLRENFVLPKRDTMRIATSLGVRHPFDHKTRSYTSVTTDLLATFRCSERTSFVAYAVKSTDDVALPRTIEKLSIERQFWEEHNIPWILRTGADLNGLRFKNLQWLFGYEEQKANVRLENVVYYLRLFENETCAAACLMADQAMGRTRGDHLAGLRYFLSTRAIACPLDVSPLPSLPAHFFTPSSQ